MQLKYLLAAAGLASAQELMRFGCAQLTIDRIDPLVNPGTIPSPHLHQLVGGNSLNASMEHGVHDPPTKSTCTSCTYSEDFSNYWTANVYFQAKNGSFKRVPQFTNLGLRTTGGITMYYIRGYQSSAKPRAFPPGFRMLVGDPLNREASKVPRQNCYRCLPNIQQNPFGGAPCTGDDTKGFPAKACGGGWRVTVTFPSCWDGKNNDSPDHKSHLSYPASGTFESGGACPSTHPVKVPQVMYEIMFDTRQFNNKADWPATGQPFWWSQGDNTGYGIHGDYLFGWKGDALQKAMDSKCANDNCPALKRQSDAEANACAKSQSAREDIGTDTWLKTLPGQSSPMAI